MASLIREGKVAEEGARSGDNKLRPATQLPEPIVQFIEQTPWTFAKTYAKTWPHEYIVREKVDPMLFAEFAEYIDKNGYKSHFYRTMQIYFDFCGYTYWHMDNIINRRPEADTYHRREKDGRLP